MAGLQDRHTQSDRVVVCASRASALALAQTRAVASKLARLGIATTVLNVTTTGDRIQDRSIAAIGSENLFVKELEAALRARRASYAVHSCKDLPSTLPADMQIAAVSHREDPRDAFCSERYASFQALPSGSRVGTSSLRRRAQLAALRADLEYVDIRGNVDTRLRKLREGLYDAIVLACAGLSRLGTRASYTVPFDVTQIVPAVAQGALAVEVRSDEGDLAQRLRAAVNDEQTEREVYCERAALRTLRGGCQAPIGVHACQQGEQLVVDAAVAAVDGSTVLRERMEASAGSREQANALGAALAQALLSKGAGVLLQPLYGKLVVVPRAQEHNARLAQALRAQGAEVLEMRPGESAPRELGERVPDFIVFTSSGSVGAASGYLQRIHRYERRPAIATMGPASSAAAHAAGFTPDLVTPEDIDALLDALRTRTTHKEHREQ